LASKNKSNWQQISPFKFQNCLFKQYYPIEYKMVYKYLVWTVLHFQKNTSPFTCSPLWFVWFWWLRQCDLLRDSLKFLKRAEVVEMIIILLDKQYLPSFDRTCSCNLSHCSRTHTVYLHMHVSLFSLSWLHDVTRYYMDTKTLHLIHITSHLDKIYHTL